MSLKTDTLGDIYDRAPQYVVRNYSGRIFSVPNNYVDNSNDIKLSGGNWYRQDDWTLVAGRGWKSNNDLFTKWMKELDKDRLIEIGTGVPTNADGTNYFWDRKQKDKDDYTKIKTDGIPGYERISKEDGSEQNPYLIAERGTGQYDIGFPLFKKKSEN